VRPAVSLPERRCRIIVVPADAARAVRAAVRRLAPGRSAHPPPVEIVAGPDGLLLRVTTADAE